MIRQFSSWCCNISTEFLGADKDRGQKRASCNSTASVLHVPSYPLRLSLVIPLQGISPRLWAFVPTCFQVRLSVCPSVRLFYVLICLFIYVRVCLSVFVCFCTPCWTPPHSCTLTSSPAACPHQDAASARPSPNTNNYNVFYWLCIGQPGSQPPAAGGLHSPYKGEGDEEWTACCKHSVWASACLRLC